MFFFCREEAEIANEIIELEKSVANIESMSHNITDVVQKYKALKLKYNETAHVIEKLNLNITALTEALKCRNRYCKITENYFISYIKYSFKKILETSNCKVINL